MTSCSWLFQRDGDHPCHDGNIFPSPSQLSQGSFIAKKDWLEITSLPKATSLALVWRLAKPLLTSIATSNKCLVLSKDIAIKTSVTASFKVEHTMRFSLKGIASLEAYESVCRLTASILRGGGSRRQIFRSFPRDKC